MKYLLYTVEGLLSEESFVNYCLNERQEDILYWEKLIKEYPELLTKVNEARTLILLLSGAASPAVKEQELYKLKAVIERTETIQIPVVRRMYFQKAIWYAAAVILISVGVFAWFNQTDYSTTVPLFQENTFSSHIKTGLDERKTITLADGTEIILNALSQLRVAPDYNQHNRVLWLNGEAHFKVAKNKEKPFIVIAGKTATTALGTSFKINNYSNSPETSVMLATGKVSIGVVNGQQITNKLQLLPGEKVSVAGKQEKMLKTTFNLREIEDWNSRSLHFSMASLKEIKTVLKTIYGVEINTSNQPKTPIAFTGEFHNESLTRVLDAIGFSNHFTYKIKNEKVTFSFYK
ncbi:FecR family protein [Pedobacter sp. MC2016-14]|uniref:FecR family protein n=1 Tax=Pedobacter sp. MC2016-14 TaxID=2897327 RepID=UPI001E5D32AA|nr:FecR family protein [Pedobacter sp. MC2016-14]MCD0488164.1 FecR family protein [Pedobacter sp. MC2016-14]